MQRYTLAYILVYLV